MIFQSLKQHFRPRLAEWWMAGWLWCWGLYVILHPDLFTDIDTVAIFSGMTAMSDAMGLPAAGLWGASAIIIAMLRGFALFINGAYTRSPIIRLVTSTLSASMVLLLVLGLQGSGVPNTGMVTYGFMVVLDLACAYFAACDIPPAERNRLIAREATRGRNPA